MRAYESPNCRWYQHFTPFGWVTFVAIAYLGLAFFFKWPPIPILDSREPSMWRYGLEVILLMVNIPLAWTAWKEVRRAVKHYWLERFLIAMWVVHSFSSVIEFRTALQDGVRLRPQTSLMLMFTLVILTMAFGRKRLPRPTDDLALNSTEQTGAVRG